MSPDLRKENGHTFEPAPAVSRVYETQGDTERGQSASPSSTPTTEHARPTSGRKEEYNKLYLFVVMSRYIQSKVKSLTSCLLIVLLPFAWGFSLFLSLLLVSLDQCIGKYKP